MDIDDKDPILDSLLDEVLAGRAPPDLTARILQASAARRYGHDQTAQQFRSSDDPAAPPILGSVQAATKQPAPAMAGAQLANASINGQPRKSESWSGAFTISVAAAILGLGLTIGLVALMRSSPVKIAHNADKDPRQASPTPKEVARAPRPPQPSIKPAPTVQEQSSVVPQLAQQEPDAPPVAVAPEVKAPQSSAQRAESVVSAAPRPRKPSSATPSSDGQIVSFVNAELTKVWKEAGVKPTPQVSDAEWCERLFQRVLGRSATADEAKSLASDKSASRREKLVERLLNQSDYVKEFADHWSAVLTNVFIGKNGGRGNSLASREELQKYFAAALSSGKAYDSVAEELLTATGASKEGADGYNPAVNFLLEGMDRSATMPTARVARVLLGHQLQCSQCHNQPTQGWKQEQFWALNAALRQIQANRQNGEVRLRSTDLTAATAEVAFETPDGTTKAVGPQFIDGTEIPVTRGVDPRQELARLVVESADFSKAAVNRIWAQLFDYGFTRPVDSLDAHSAVTAPAVLDRLAAEFAAHEFDLKRLIRWAVLSDPFGRSSKLADLASKDMPEEGEPALFSRFYARPSQGPAVLLALREADRIRARGGSRTEVENARVTWLQANRASAKADKNAGPAVMPQSGDLQHKSVSGDPTGLVKKLTASKMPFDKQVEHLFVEALARPPRPPEQQAALQLVRSNRGNQAAALEDLWWALQNSSDCVLDR